MPVFYEPINVTDPAFKKVERSPIPVLIFFWKGNCPPCDRMQEALKRLAREFAGDVLIVRANLTDTPSAAQKYRVEAVPTMVFLKNGAEVERIVGEVGEQMLRQKLEEVLGKRPRSGSVRGGASVPVSGARPTTPPGGGHGATRPGQQAQASHPDTPVVVTDATFQNVVLNARVPVVVDFWAPWCAPCRMIAPVLEQMAREYAGKLLVAKLNVDENPRTAAMFGVRSIPTLIVFRNGQAVDRIVGALPGPVLRQRVRQAAGI